jgi:hypothetical protein
MSTRNAIAIALLLLLGPLSLHGKLSASGHDSLSSTPAPIPRAEAILADGELVRIASRTMIDSAAYRLAVYRHHMPDDCSGLLYLMPMATNAEAIKLLTRAFSPRVTDHFFVLDGNLSESFPAWRQWQLRASARLQRLFGHAAPMPVVHGVATTDACLGARRLNWSTLRI